MKRTALALLSTVALADTAFAQATSVQQAGTRLDAATGVAFAQSAVGTTSTATITVPAGQYAYITGISVDVCADATGGSALANFNITTTNVQSTPSLATSFSGATQTCAVPIREAYATPVKSAQPGVNVTLAATTPGTHNQATIRAYFYLAP